MSNNIGKINAAIKLKASSLRVVAPKLESKVSETKSVGQQDQVSSSPEVKQADKAQKAVKQDPSEIGKSEPETSKAEAEKAELEKQLAQLQKELAQMKALKGTDSKAEAVKKATGGGKCGGGACGGAQKVAAPKPKDHSDQDLQEMAQKLIAVSQWLTQGSQNGQANPQNPSGANGNASSGSRTKMATASPSHLKKQLLSKVQELKSKGFQPKPETRAVRYASCQLISAVGSSVQLSCP